MRMLYCVISLDSPSPTEEQHGLKEAFKKATFKPVFVTHNKACTLLTVIILNSYAGTMSVIQTLNTKPLLLTCYRDEPLSYYTEQFANLQRYVLS